MAEAAETRATIALTAITRKRACREKMIIVTRNIGCH